MRVVAACAAAVALLVLAPAAGAATVRSDGGVLRVTAGAGEQNELSVSRVADDLVVSDAGEPSALAAGPSCDLDTVDDEVTCPAAGVARAEIDAGDRDDEVAYELSLPASILGGSGLDELTGGDGADTLEGEDGIDTLRGGAGGDVLRGGPGSDSLLGEAGADSLSGDLDDDSLAGGDGDDAVHGGDGRDALSGELGNDVVAGGAADDFVSGGDGSDVLDGAEGNDSLNGDTGDDNVSGGSGTDALTGGDGNDTLAGGTEDDSLNGDLGDDRVLGDSGDDTVFGGAGNDSVSGGTEDDSLNGDVGDDRLLGDSGNDTVSGGAGNDGLGGGDGNDHALGGSGNDRVNGDRGSDRVDGGSGNDRLEVRDRKPDSVLCGSGRDFARAEVLDALDFACERVDYGRAGSVGRLRALTGGGRFVRVPGQATARVDRRILKDVLYLIRRYKVRVGDGYALTGHKRHGEHPLGLAVDLYPGAGGSWRQLAKLAKWAEPRQNRPRWPFRWVGWNGDALHGDPKHCRPSRGCPPHLHLSWAHSPGKPGRPVRRVWVWQVTSNPGP